MLLQTVLGSILTAFVFRFVRSLLCRMYRTGTPPYIMLCGITCTELQMPEYAAGSVVLRYADTAVVAFYDEIDEARYGGKRY